MPRKPKAPKKSAAPKLPGAAKQRAKERAAEKREMELRDIPPELRRYAQKRRNGMSAAEATQHWAEENPEEYSYLEQKRADREAAAMWKKENTQPTERTYFRKGKKAMVRIVVYRPITPKSKHFGEVDLPF